VTSILECCYHGIQTRNLNLVSCVHTSSKSRHFSAETQFSGNLFAKIVQNEVCIYSSKCFCERYKLLSSSSSHDACDKCPWMFKQTDVSARCHQREGLNYYVSISGVARRLAARCGRCILPPFRCRSYRHRVQVNQTY